MVSFHHVTAHLTNQKQAFSIATDNHSYHVGESCFRTVHLVSQKKPILSADNAGFKPKIGFTTGKPSFSQKLPFSLEILDPHCESCFTVVKQDSLL